MYNQYKKIYPNSIKKDKKSIKELGMVDGDEGGMDAFLRIVLV